MADKNVTAESYTLYTEDGNWLGQVILTSNCTFASVTDWGNLSFSWSNIGDRTFKEFLMGISIDYFGDKLYTGMSYILSTARTKQACKTFAKNILPALQHALREEASTKSLETYGKQKE